MPAAGIEPIYVALGKRLALLRRERGLTQDQLAVSASVSTNYLARVEGGQHRATLTKLESIAQGLSVDVAALFDEREPVESAGALPELVAAVARLSRADQRALLKVVERLPVVVGTSRKTKAGSRARG